MKKLATILFILFFASFAHAWTLTWDDVTGEDGYIVYWKQYPVGYSFPDNPAPTNEIQDMTTAVEVNLTADVTEWDLSPTDFTEGQRYVFMVRATKSGSVSGKSDHLCWTYPFPTQIVELPVESGADIQINIYQQP